MAEAKVTFDRLNDFNWATWSFRMELMLMKEDVWSTVKDPKPGEKEITSAWTRKDEKARAMIGLALEDSQLSHIMNVSSAKEMWEKLKGYHERGSLTNKIHVLRRLCSMRLEEGGSMSDHLVEAAELVHRLTRMGEVLKEHLVVAILLSSLPESYNPLVTALEGRPEDELKLDYVKGKLLDEWRRRSNDRKPEEVKAMKSTSEDRRNAVWTCYYCQQKGHMQRNCPVLLEECKANMKKKYQQDPGSDNGSKGVCFTSTTGSSAKCSDERWILDTGCTKHMTGSLMKLDSRVSWKEDVLLADGKTVMAEGRGTGRIIGRGKEGEPIEVKLKELLYVPDLAVSVLSVSRITDQGYAVVFGPRDCQILVGTTVLAVGEKCGDLYYLKQ